MFYETQPIVALFPKPALRRGLSRVWNRRLTYFAYLDEFGHIGPYISRNDPTYNESPVFGLAGFVLPAQEVRGFGTWFFQRKCQLLEFEITRSGEHPALWEKKGSSLYTTVNVTKYVELRKLTNRLLNKIDTLGGFVFYVGVRKTADWIAGLIGRIAAVWADPVTYPENVVFRRYFERRLNRVSHRSGIRI